MLDQVDLKKKLDKKDYKEQFPQLQKRLQELEKEMWDEKIPIIIAFEGWDASGKGMAIEKIVERMDPRGFKVFRIHEPTEEEKFRPFLWRFWTKTPGRGRIAIFHRSWYGRVLVERVDKLCSKDDWQNSYNEIRNFERQLAEDGAVIIKFFMHVSKKEERKRFERCEDDKYQTWKITDDDWKHYKQYDKYYTAAEEMLQKTSTHYAPWTVIEASDQRWSNVKIFSTIIEACLQGLQRKRQREAALKVAPVTDTEQITKHTHPTILDRVDLTLKLEDKKYDEEVKKYQAKIRELEQEIYKARIPVVVAYEGWDAGGKGGNIKRLTSSLDPRGYEVTPIAAPTTEEKAHHHLWRFWNQLPKAGHISIFDRTWYGRVLVERVERFCHENDWRRAYQEINEFEEDLANYGTAICKFWIHISKDEQMRRFKERQEIDYKRFKITDDDWRNREKWDVYEEAILDMLERTSTTYAPWTIVEGEDKNWARVRTLKTVCEAIERRL